MASFTAINRPGVVFNEQENNGSFDPFAVLGLHADDTALSMYGVRLHFRKQVINHVFERAGSKAASSAPNIRGPAAV